MSTPDREGDEHAAAAAARDPGPPAAQAELERRYHPTRHAETPTRYQMLLLCAQGRTPAYIAQLTRRSPDPVRRVLKRYLAGGLWTCRLLAAYLHGAAPHRAGIETVRIAPHRAGFVCKRPRWVLTRKVQANRGG